MIDHSPTPENPLAATQLVLNDLITTAPSPESLSDSELEDMHRFVAYAMGQVAVLGEAVVAEQVRRQEAVQEPERPRPNEIQREKLQQLCASFKVPYSEGDYFVYPADSSMMAGWVEGYVGGSEYAGKTIYVGISPTGESHS